MEYDVSINEGIAELGIFEKNSDAWVSTRHIAKLFEKDHGKVLRKIENEIINNVTDKFNEANFRLVKYKDAKGEKRPEYLLNRKSVSLVIMSFTGKKAIQFKQAYIEAFEAMHSVITTRILSKEGYKIMTGAIKSINKNASPLDYSKEADMINKVILKMSAKDFKSVNDTANTRDVIIQSQLDKLDHAQRLNADLILAGIEFHTRKWTIENRFQDGK